MSSKKCGCCTKEFQLTEFYNNNYNWDGLDHWCKLCRKFLYSRDTHNNQYAKDYLAEREKNEDSIYQNRKKATIAATIKPVKITNLKTNKTKSYKSRTDAAKDLGISVYQIQWGLKRGTVKDLKFENLSPKSTCRGKVKIRLKNLKSKQIHTFESIKSASKKLKLYYTSIHRAYHRKSKHKNWIAL